MPPSVREPRRRALIRDHFIYIRIAFKHRCPLWLDDPAQMTMRKTVLETRHRGQVVVHIAQTAQADDQDLKHGLETSCELLTRLLSHPYVFDQLRQALCVFGLELHMRREAIRIH